MNEGKALISAIKQNDGYGYELAFRLAVEKLAEIEDIEQQCRRCGARFLKSEKIISLDYLNRTYLIKYPEAEVTFKDTDEHVTLVDKILLLHYVAQVSGTPLSGQLISFKELSEAVGYFPTFYKRAIKPLVMYFGNEPDKLLEMAESVGGRKADFGDVSTTVNPLPMVPLTLVLWKGDADFSPEGTIMFDRTITDYLPTEDIIILCQNTSWRLVKLLKSGT
ncbi:MAG TPA: DUF3786 domain-containing protein [Dehalococcoidia bacterium]|nr:DUF3786 domain-containing protein [Dehalococcoidia bacterium]